MKDDYITVLKKEHDVLMEQSKFLAALYSTDIPNTPDFQVAINRWLSSKDENYVA